MNAIVPSLPEPYTSLRRKTLATRCLACGLPLCDAESVTLALGPDCRKRLGITRRLRQKSAANTLIASAAIAAEHHQTREALSLLRELVTLDPAYQTLVDRAHSQMFKLRVVADGQGFRVYTLYDDGFVQACKEMHLRWLPVERCRVFPREKADGVMLALARCWPDGEVLMPDGAVVELQDLADVLNRRGAAGEYSRAMRLFAYEEHLGPTEDEVMESWVQELAL